MMPARGPWLLLVALAAWLASGAFGWACISTLIVLTGLIAHLCRTRLSHAAVIAGGGEYSAWANDAQGGGSRPLPATRGIEDRSACRCGARFHCAAPSMGGLCRSGRCWIAASPWPRPSTVRWRRPMWGNGLARANAEGICSLPQTVPNHALDAGSAIIATLIHKPTPPGYDAPG